jgi:hypothetical protein
MGLTYEDLVFKTAPTDEVPDLNQTEMYNHMMSLLRLPENTNLRCDNLKMAMSKGTMPKENTVYFQLDRKFDIFFGVTGLTNASAITKIQVCYQQCYQEAVTIEPVQDVMLNTDIVIPLYNYQYTPLYIKVEYSDTIQLPEEVEMTYSAGLLQTKYRRDRTIKFPFSQSHNLL